MVPLVVALGVSAGNADSTVALPDRLSSVDKMRPESCLVSILLVGREATLVTEEVRGWLVFPTAVGLFWDMVSDANETP